MTETSATPESKRITRNRPTEYPAQIVFMASDGLAAAVAAQAEAEGVSKAVIARRWMTAGAEYEAHLDGRDIPEWIAETR